jgi:hypothetical protein
MKFLARVVRVSSLMYLHLMMMKDISMKILQPVGGVFITLVYFIVIVLC